MCEFKRIVASVKSINMRKPLYGLGINDAWYVVSKKIDGKLHLCPIYRVWSNMLMRCYRKEYGNKHPSYKDCTVCDDWLVFSNFALWASDKMGAGLDLDKDIKIPNNKSYSPEACLFVSKEVNYIILGKRRNSRYKQGVSWCSRDKVFNSFISVKGKSKYLGAFSTEDDASESYIKAKKERIVATRIVKFTCQQKKLCQFGMRVSL